MKQDFRINLLLNKREFNIFLKCIDNFKSQSNFFNNDEWNVESEELRTKILDNYSTENK